MSGWTFAWILWAAMFAAVEGAALANRDSGDTLSEHIWAVFAVRGKPAGWMWRRGILGVGLTWLVGHLMFGIWGG